ncbi:tetratricopeptide repeat protein [Alisedimentitalea sp. MJ-SS2]|uniref:tetratricopeptide repeat protein n=1 Tax=Aliisedimentitalea sp. MJ-SS2 TaxID=3049795 RepID=UPI0029153BDF|nr:tetratricopeptide repeat protein [Alisedimentitalea sp. MJ-SS2]MDU8929702.1 tetratricopeptide repeat protein [Alisedimentitalea sp. MJ-SS2]
MTQRLFAAFFLVVSLVLPAHSDAGDIDDARLAYIAGQYDAALKILVPAAKGGDANAQNIVGAAYEDGNGVPRSIVTAVAWYEKSAAQGFAKGQHNLGLVLLRGEDAVPADMPRVARLFEAAMAQGFAPSFWERGRMLRDGIGGDADLDAARAVFESGHAAGDGLSGVGLGEMYRTGHGVEADPARARAIYEEAAKTGYGVAIGNLAIMYEEGIGGEMDVEKAHALYQEAVARGDGNAAVNLGEFLVNQPGEWQSAPRGWAFCLLGQRMAHDARQAMELRMTCKDLRETISDADAKQGEVIFNTQF